MSWLGGQELAAGNNKPRSMLPIRLGHRDRIPKTSLHVRCYPIQGSARLTAHAITAPTREPVLNAGPVAAFAPKRIMRSTGRARAWTACQDRPNAA